MIAVYTEEMIKEASRAGIAVEILQSMLNRSDNAQKREDKHFEQIRQFEPLAQLEKPADNLVETQQVEEPEKREPQWGLVIEPSHPDCEVDVEKVEVEDIKIAPEAVEQTKEANQNVVCKVHKEPKTPREILLRKESKLTRARRLQREQEAKEESLNLRSARSKKTKKFKAIKQTKPITRGAKELALVPYTPAATRHNQNKRVINLNPVNIDTYHPKHLRNESVQKIIDVASNCQRSQVDSFSIGSHSFIVTSWLTAARIFQYEDDHYIEVKRLPQRYIEISDNLVTSIHYDDSKLYIAYLCGSDEKEANPCQPYMDVLNPSGKPVKKRQYYKDIVKFIYSDQEYIYVKTASNMIHIHPKTYFNCICYKIGFQEYGHFIKTWIERPTFQIKTTLPLVTVRTKDILLTKWDILDGHEITCCYRFHENYITVSCYKVDDLFIIHRVLESPDDLNTVKSILEFGYTTGEKDNPDTVFVHEISLKLNYSLIQIVPLRELLFIFGYTARSGGKRHYEIGCIFLPCLRPLWTTQVTNVDENCHILAHTNHIVIIKERQEIASFQYSNQNRCEKCKFNLVSKLDDKWHTESKHDSIFTGYQIYRNTYMQNLGASIFKKLD